MAQKKSPKKTTKNQHFVPKVYLKRWAIDGTENQVFRYEKCNLSDGKQRNVTSILYGKNIYTVTFQDYYALDFMPKIKRDFAKQLDEILDRYDAVAYYNDKKLRSGYKALEFIGNVDEWDFRLKSNRKLPASKRGIVENIKQIRSYVIEDALDNIVEKNWNSVLDVFLQSLTERKKLLQRNLEIPMESQLVQDLILTMLIFMCRTPTFDCLGVFPKVKNIAQAIAKDANMDDDFVDRCMRNEQISQLYKAIFSGNVGFLASFMPRIIERCRIIVFHCDEQDGSFITSDNPSFSYVSPMTFLNYNGIYLPLTPQYLLCLGQRSQDSIYNVDYREIQNNTVRKINAVIRSSASQYIVSNRKLPGIIL